MFVEWTFAETGNLKVSTVIYDLMRRIMTGIPEFITVSTNLTALVKPCRIAILHT